MHYKNGREVKVGDKAVGRSCDGSVVAGVVVATTPGNTSCNIQMPV